MEHPVFTVSGIVFAVIGLVLWLFGSSIIGVTLIVIGLLIGVIPKIADFVFL